jgi:hypothetical protein
MPRKLAAHAAQMKAENDKQFLKLVDALVGDTQFCSEVSLSEFSKTRLETLNSLIIKHASTVTFNLPNNDPYRYVNRRICAINLSTLPGNSAIPQLQALFIQANSDRNSQHTSKVHLANELGLRIDDGLFDLPVYTVKRRSDENVYPPLHHFVHERPDLPVPPVPPITDRTCGSCSKFHTLDETQLSVTLYENDSGIFVDADTGELVGIQIRNFARGEPTEILEWGTALIRESIDRRYLCQRNNPGSLARVGVSTGPRSAQMFGWVRNLKKRFLKGDRNDHDANISSLFGLFYALIRSRVSPVANHFEDVMSSSGLPPLDPTRSECFRLPLRPGHSVSFNGYPLAPPEGYIAVDFTKQIHNDTHWVGCPWACSWNLSRTQPDNQVGASSGASFYISSYGIRIINSSNSMTGWRVSDWHGTGWYYNNLSHVGLSLLLSRSIQTAWENYKSKLESGELAEGDLLWSDSE